jgi:hypothetical protein
MILHPLKRPAFPAETVKHRFGAARRINQASLILPRVVFTFGLSRPLLIEAAAVRGCLCLMIILTALITYRDRHRISIGLEKFLSLPSQTTTTAGANIYGRFKTEAARVRFFYLFGPA